jgi:UDP-N-acetylglucosamine transferase subunit ALG13
MKQTQQYLIKLAHHQSEIAKRLSSWPFLAVSNTEGDD